MILWCACLLLAAPQQATRPAPKSTPPNSTPPKSAPVAPAQPQPQPQPLQLPPAPTPDAKPAVVPWEGTLRAGQTRVQELALAQKYDEALALGERLLAMPSWEQQPERDRAEALYALGVARGTAEKVDDAAVAFHRASGLAGSDALGLDSIYGAGTFRLLKAEDLRKNIPEIREKLGLQPLPQQQPAPMPLGAAPGLTPAAASAAHPELDPLSIAREAYLAARRDLVERLRCDTRDRDTRGNLELTQRRLRELDAIEKKRQEEEQKQKDEQKQDDKQDKQKQDPNQKDKQDQQKQDDKQQPQDQQKKDDQQKQDEQNKQDEQKQDQKDAQPKDDKPKDAQPDPKSAPAEQFLSNEEVMRLLDHLKQIEQQAEQVRAALRERHRVPVKKDW